MAGFLRLMVLAALLGACSDTAVTGVVAETDARPGGVAAADGGADGGADAAAGVADSDADGAPDVAPDEEGPIIEVLLPADGATVSGLVTVHLTATDPSGVASLLADIDGAALTDANPAPGVLLATWDTLASPDGQHKLSARAVDALGNEAWLTVPLVSHNGAGKLVAGSVSLGYPVVGATVRVYDRGVSGALGLALGEAVTAPDGSFSLQTDREAASGWGVVVVAGPGGEVQDPETGEVLELASDDALRAVIPLPPGEGSVVVRVHGWTTLATRLVEGLERWGTDFDEAPALAAGLVGEHLRRPIPVDLQLVEPALPAGDAFVWPKPAALVGLTHVGLARMARERGGTILDAVRLLAADLTDAVFDGKGALDTGAGGPLKWPGTKPVHTEDSRYELAVGLAAWAGETWTDKAHPPGVTAADLQAAGGFLDTIASDDSPLYPSAGWLFDEDPPDVQWLPPTPASKTWVGPEGTVTLAAHATDKSPLAAFTLTVAGAAHAATLAGTTLTGTVDLTQVPDGELEVVAAATDTSRGALSGTATRLLWVDRTAPTMPAAQVSPPSGGTTNQDAVTLTVAATDEGSGIVAVDATPLAGCEPCAPVPLVAAGAGAWSATLPLPLEGDNGFLLRARDLAGNVAELAWEVRRDTEAPVVVYQGSSYVDAGELELDTVNESMVIAWSNEVAASLAGPCCLQGGAGCDQGECSSTLQMFVQDLTCGDHTPHVEVRVLDPDLDKSTLTLQYGWAGSDGVVWVSSRQVALAPDGTADVRLCGDDLGVEFPPAADTHVHAIRLEAADLAGNTSAPFDMSFEIAVITPPLWVGELPAGEPKWTLAGYGPSDGTLQVPFAPTTGGADGMAGHFRIGGSRVVNPHAVPIHVSAFPQPIVTVSRATRRTYLKVSPDQPQCAQSLCTYVWGDASAEETPSLGACVKSLYFAGGETWEPIPPEVRTYALVGEAAAVDVTAPTKLTIPPKTEVHVVTHLISGGTCAVKPPRAHTYGGQTLDVYLRADVDDAAVPCPPGDAAPGEPAPVPVGVALSSCKSQAGGAPGGSYLNPRVVTGVRLQTLTSSASAVVWNYWADDADLRNIKGPSIGALIAPANESLKAPTTQWPPASPN